jgi:GTP-binding protein HflX
VILSDTVGFISQLPHELVSAFHATLEEVVEADVIVHVRDVATGDTTAQKEDVLVVLRDMGLDDTVQESLIEALNKADLLPAAEKEVLSNQAARSNIPCVLLSAATGEGCERLTAAIDERITKSYRLFEISLSHGDGSSLAWLYDHGDMVERRDEADAIHLKVRLDPANWARFQQRRP